MGIGKPFEEDLVVIDLEVTSRTASTAMSPLYEKEQYVFMALVLGVRDYFRKTAFKKAVIGLSGGIDSSLAAAIAVEALGQENVVGVSMPSRYSSEHSKCDAELLSRNLGITCMTIPIDGVFESIREDSGAVFGETACRRYRREYSSKNPRKHLDGALKQVRVPRLDDRKQD